MAALERIAPDGRAVLAAHIALKFMDRSRFRSAEDVQRNGLMGIAAQTLHLQIAVSGIEGITQSRRGLGWPLKGLRRTNGRAIDRFSDLVPMARASPGRAWSASREADFPIYCPHVLMLFTGEPTVSCGCSSGRAPISISHCPMMERSIRFRWGTGLRGRD
jgi:hypothetical protein